MLKSPRFTLVALCYVLTALAETTTTTTTVRTTYTGENGYIVPVYSNGGVVRYYQKGAYIDSTMIYGLRTIAAEPETLDLKNKDSAMYEKLFSRIYQTFRAQYSLNDKGEFVRNGLTETPAGKLTLDLFKLYANEASPELQRDEVVTCQRCTGSGLHPGVVPDYRTPSQGGLKKTSIGNVVCTKCGGYGHHIHREVFKVKCTGSLPTRPTKTQLIEAGLIKAPTAAPVKPALLPLPVAPTLPTAPAPVAAMPIAQPVPTAKKIELTPEEQIKSIKGKADGGDTPSQYELALMYSGITPSMDPSFKQNPFEAQKLMEKAAEKNHKLAAWRLAEFYEKGKGVEANGTVAYKWRKISARLGCREAQNWMGRLYESIFKERTICPDADIKRDPDNLEEAYAWFSLVSAAMTKRIEHEKPTDAELKSGDTVLNSRDYQRELGLYQSSAQPRDLVIKQFKNADQAAKAERRSEILAAEIADYQMAHKPK